MAKPMFKNTLKNSVWAAVAQLPAGSFLVELEGESQFSLWFASKASAIRVWNKINQMADAGCSREALRLWALAMARMA